MSEIKDWRWLLATPLKWEKFTGSGFSRSWITTSTKYGHADTVFPPPTLPMCCCTCTLRERSSGRLLARGPRMRRRFPFSKRKRFKFSSPTPLPMEHSSYQTLRCHHKRGLSMSPSLVMKLPMYLKPEMTALRKLNQRNFSMWTSAWMRRRSSWNILKIQWPLISLIFSLKSRRSSKRPSRYFTQA